MPKVLPDKQRYKEVRVFQYPGMTVRVHIPDLTPEERTRRMQAIHKQAERLLKMEEIHNERV